MTEAEAVLLAQQGDKAAFGRLIELHAGWVRRAAVRWVRNAADADDVAQKTFIVAWAKIGTYLPGKGPFGAWLGGILRNTAFAHLREKDKRLRFVDPIDSILHLAVTEGPLAQGEDESGEMAAFRRCWESLSEEEKTLLAEYYINRIPRAALAERLRLTVNALGVRVHRLCERLMKCIRQRGGTP